VIIGSQRSQSPRQYCCVCGTWNISSMYGSGTRAEISPPTAAYSSPSSPSETVGEGHAQSVIAIVATNRSPNKFILYFLVASVVRYF
jgi:hypothetical protein